MKLTVAVQIAAMCVGNSLGSSVIGSLNDHLNPWQNAVLQEYRNDDPRLLEACKKWSREKIYAEGVYIKGPKALRDGDPNKSIKDGRLQVVCYSDGRPVDTIQIPIKSDRNELDFHQMAIDRNVEKEEIVKQQRPEWLKFWKAYSEGNRIYEAW